MSFAELVTKRQSCREYKADKVPREKLESLFATVRLAPSGCNGQPWRFVAVDDEAVVKQVADCMIDDEVVPGNRFALQVPAFIVVLESQSVLLPKIAEKCGTQHYAQMDIGIAVAHLILAAEDEGLDTCVMGWFDDKKIKEILQIPDELTLRLVIAVGYGKDDTVRRKARKSLSRIVSYNQF